MPSEPFSSNEGIITVYLHWSGRRILNGPLQRVCQLLRWQNQPHLLGVRLWVIGTNWDVQGSPTCPVCWDSFQLVQPKDVDRIVGGEKLISCIL